MIRPPRPPTCAPPPADAARDNGGRLVSLTQLTEDGLPSGVEVSVAVDGEHPVRGAGARPGRVHGGRASGLVPAGRPARAVRPRGRGGGGRRPGRMALRLGRREPCRGRLRLQRPGRLRVHGCRARRCRAGPPPPTCGGWAGRSRLPCCSRATWCSSAPPAARPTTSASTWATAPCCRLRTPARGSATRRSRTAAGMATRACCRPGRRRSTIRSRPPPAAAACPATCLRPSCAWVWPATRTPPPPRWRAPRRRTRARSRRRWRRSWGARRRRRSSCATVAAPASACREP